MFMRVCSSSMSSWVVHVAYMWTVVICMAILM